MKPRGLLLTIWLPLQWLSLDIAAGAAAGGWFVYRLLGITPDAVWLCLLGAAVWMVYTLDHLIDIWTHKELVHERHRFHHRYKTPLTAGVILTGAVSLCVALTLLNSVQMIAAFAVAGLAFIHLLGVAWMSFRKTYLPVKEISVALVYTAGIWIVPVAEKGFDEISGGVWLISLQFFFLALSNLILLAWLDSYEEKTVPRTSVLARVGQAAGGFSAGLAMADSVIAGALAIWFFPEFRSYELLLSLVTLGHAVVFMFPSYFYTEDRYRRIADASYLLLWLSVVV